MKGIGLFISGFISFLNKSIPVIDEICSHLDEIEGEEFVNNWLQANWELIVEAQVTVNECYLEVYGDGADLYGGSSRILFKDKLPTHQVLVLNKKGNTMHLDKISNTLINTANTVFHSFVNFENGKFCLKTPLNSVLLEGENGIVLIDLNEVDFFVSKLD